MLTSAPSYVRYWHFSTILRLTSLQRPPVVGEGVFVLGVENQRMLEEGDPIPSLPPKSNRSA